jgi:hypothetical protein
MPNYLTTEAFRVMGFGVDLSAFEEVEVRNILARASARVNTYCAVPNLPQPHDFRGGTVVGEQHSWAMGSDLVAGQRRFYAWHRPIKAISQFRVVVTNQQYVGIAASELFINHSEGYVEVVSLAVTSVGIFGSALIPNLGLARPVGQMDYTYGWSFPIVGEELLDTDGETFRAQNQWWDADVTPTVYVNGSEVTTGFALDYNEGVVVFDDMPAATDTVTLDYNHTLPNAIASATGSIATHMIGESRFAARGMVGVGRIKVAEVEISRSAPVRGRDDDAIPDEAASLLEPYRFLSVYGGS